MKEAVGGYKGRSCPADWWWHRPCWQPSSEPASTLPPSSGFLFHKVSDFGAENLFLGSLTTDLILKGFVVAVSFLCKIYKTSLSQFECEIPHSPVGSCV